MTKSEVIVWLKAHGNDGAKKVLVRHGAKEPFFGVRLADLRKIKKQIKTDHALAIELFETGISDAMYLAGLIVDPAQMKKTDLQNWANKSYWYLLSEYTVAWVAAESQYGKEMALKWIASPEERIASAGWATLSSLVGIKPDESLDISYLGSLLDDIEKHIHESANRVRYTMNSFVIASGIYVAPLNEKALEVGGKIGKVSVDMGGTACKVPDAVDYINKIRDAGKIGKKRKSARC